MTEEKIRELIEEAQNGNIEARNEIIMANLPLVKYVMRRTGYSTSFHQHVHDMYQEGILGLIHAIKKFKLSRRTKFGTYAYDWVRNYMSRYVQGKTRNVRIPYNKIEKYSKIVRKLNKGKRVSRKELDSMPNIQTELSLNYVVGDNEASMFHGKEDLEFAEIEKKIDVKHFLTTVKNERTRAILKEYMKGKNYRMIGDKFHLSRERISQIMKKVLKKLREEK